MSVINKYMSYMKASSAVDITFMCIKNKQKICKIGGGRGIWCWFSYFKNKKIKIYFTNLWYGFTEMHTFEHLHICYSSLYGDFPCLSTILHVWEKSVSSLDWLESFKVYYMYFQRYTNKNYFILGN